MYVKEEVAIDNVISCSAQVPRVLVRVALVTTNLAAPPLLSFSFAAVLVLGIAAGGASFQLFLRFLDMGRLLVTGFHAGLTVFRSDSGGSKIARVITARRAAGDLI